ncbi:hypothetical protein AgCh_010495 [Apium graveolens]
MFSDSDWAGNVNDRKSVGAYSLLLGDVAVSWRLKKQHVTSHSSAETEYRALADASCEIIRFLNLLQELHIPFSGPVPLYCDNKADVDLTANLVYHAYTKHIELDCHFIREKIQLGIVVVHQIPTLKNTADILTKGLGKTLHWSCAAKLGLLAVGPSPICGGISYYQSTGG